MSGLDHDILRHLADTWGLLLLFGLFVIAVGMALRPGAGERFRAAARIPLEDEGEPKP